ncbi:hypothetical protein MC28_F170 (plasmid) [Bacillus thuringiensis MC28]|nr:hypothetical protein MC28_F170 [Bacillus thuringiensis MC28]
MYVFLLIDFMGFGDLYNLIHLKRYFKWIKKLFPFLFFFIF